MRGKKKNRKTLTYSEVAALRGGEVASWKMENYTGSQCMDSYAENSLNVL